MKKHFFTYNNTFSCFFPAFERPSGILKKITKMPVGSTEDPGGNAPTVMAAKKTTLVDIPDLTRLPKTTVPKRYELKLDVEPEEKTFAGQVNIR